MWGIAAAIALAYGLIRAAAASPDRKIERRRRKLGYLKAELSAGQLTLDQAEDGIVLARAFQDAEFEQKFRKATASLKRSRKE